MPTEAFDRGAGPLSVWAKLEGDRPPPHFHVRYGKQKAIVGINPLTILKGELSTRTWNLVREWALEHQAELLENWERARLAKPLEPIEPLE